MSEHTPLEPSAAVALIVAAADVVGACPPGPEARSSWEGEVRTVAFDLLRMVPDVVERAAVLAACHPVTGVIVSVRDVSGRAVITTRPTMGNRDSEDFRTPWLNEPEGAAMAARARALVGRHVRIGKRIEATADGQRKVGMCEWITDLGPGPEASPPAPAHTPSRTAPAKAPPAAPTAAPAAGGTSSRLAVAYPGLVGDAERAQVLAMARQLAGERREAFVAWLRDNGVPPLIHPELTAEQALRARAFMANLDGAHAARAGSRGAA